MATMTKRTCANKRCKAKFEARTADVKRGWGKFCSKSCKAVKQEARTGQYAQFKSNGGHKDPAERAHEEAMDAMEEGWDGHKNAL